LVMRNNMGTPMVLQALARQNPRDRMAFEYLMAQYLLGGELNRFAEDLSRIGQYDYESLPGHYMEAMTLYNLLEGESLTVPGLKPDPGTSERCQRFSALYREYNGDPEAMLAATNREMTGTYFSYYYALMTSGKLLAEEQAPVDVE